MHVYFATDHAGFRLKEELMRFVRDELHFSVTDYGAYLLDTNDDYPDFVAKAAKQVSQSPTDRAIILGGSGQGEAIVANKYPYVRAAVYYGGSLDLVRLSREHNDANVLSLGARFLATEEARDAVRLWLTTQFSNDERHIRRIQKTDDLLIR